MSLLEESVVVCRNCGENGHWTLKCPKRDQLSTSTSASASTSTFTPAASPKHADVTTLDIPLSVTNVLKDTSELLPKDESKSPNVTSPIPVSIVGSSDANRERDECLKTGQGLRDEGNIFFKNGDYKNALSKYTKVFLWINGFDVGGGLAEIMASNDGSKSTSKETPPLTGVALTIRSLRISANLNCSVCYLKLGDAERAIHFAQRAIDLGIINSKNKKSIYRRGQALLAKGEIDAAESDLAVALIAFPKDVGVKHDINKLAEKRKLHVAKQREQFKGLFDKKPNVATNMATNVIKTDDNTTVDIRSELKHDQPVVTSPDVGISPPLLAAQITAIQNARREVFGADKEAYIKAMKRQFDPFSSRSSDDDNDNDNDDVGGEGQVDTNMVSEANTKKDTKSDQIDDMVKIPTDLPRTLPHTKI